VIKSLGITVLAALHDLELAARYCDVIYMLNDGRIECSGSPQEVITDGMIRRIYGVEADVGRNAATGALQVHYFALTKNQSVSKTTGGIR
jgi:iron complex transport system ATP-binding protein